MSPQNDFPQTVDALNTLATRSRQSPEGYVSILFTHPTPCPFFSLLTSYCLYFSSLLHPVELSETSSGFLNYIQFPVSAASVKTVVSSEVCSLQRYVQNVSGHERRWDLACRFLFIVPRFGIDPGLGTCQTSVLILMALVPHC